MQGSLVCLAAAMLLASAAGTAFSQTAGATGNDAWVERNFDFAAPALNFRGLVPKDAKVETVAMPAMAPQTIGNVKIVGKVMSGKLGPGKGGLQVETTIVGYNLQAPGAASRLCAFEAQASGYATRAASVTRDLTEARLLANQRMKGAPQSTSASYCFSRANQALAVHFVAGAEGTETAEVADARARQVEAYARSFIQGMKFSDGASPSLGHDLQTVPLRIGDTQTQLRVLNGWDIPINDFRGSLPAELHLRQRKNGKDVGLVWLSMFDAKQKPDLDRAGVAIVKDYFGKQSADVQAPVLLSSKDDPLLAQRGIAARTFRFSVRNRQGVDAGEIDATVAWRDGRVHVLTLWSAWKSEGGRNSFFSRLPGLTVYDSVYQDVLNKLP